MPRGAASDFGFSTPAQSRLQPPDDLNPLERQEFLDVVNGIPANHFQPCDTATLAQYARAVVAERRAAGELDAAPVVDNKPSPWLPIWLGQLRACTTLARRLSINPAGRGSAPAPELPRVSYYSRMQQEAEDHDAAN
jgi:hypothetical protein